MTATHFTVSVFIMLLLIASAVAMATKWVRVPYTLALVIVGLVISPMHFLPVVHISPELILLIFLPALLFEAAWNLRMDQLRANLAPILLLSVFGVCLSVGVVGLILHAAVGLSWRLAFLFGAMISATDPVSVLAVFKKFALSKRLSTIVEGESLFNDGTAVVVFRIVLGFVAGTAADFTGQLLLGSLREFGVVVFGGIAAGAVIGLLASTLTSYFDDHLLEITLTTIAAYGSFLLAEGLHVSPVIAVLVTGLVIGNHGRRTGMSPTTQIAVSSFWEYAAFVVNSLVFLLIGLEVPLSALLDNAYAVGWGVIAMLAGRITSVYLLTPLAKALGSSISLRWQHVLFWGGLRGSLSIALVLSLPREVPGRPELVALIFGTVIFSLLVQGLTIAPLLHWLGLGEMRPELKEYERLQGRILAEAAAISELEALRGQGMLTEVAYRKLQSEAGDVREELARKMAELYVADQALEQQQLNWVRSRLADVRKARLAALVRQGILSSAAYDELTAEHSRSKNTESGDPGGGTNL